MNCHKASCLIRRAVIGFYLVCLRQLLGGCVWQAAQFWVAGEQVELRETDPDERPAPADKPKMLILAIDGVDRHLLYRMRETDPGVRIWVGMHQFYTGADPSSCSNRESPCDWAEPAREQDI